MEKFENVTSTGNEKAIRRGNSVPEGDINIAWVKSPTFSPQNSMVVLDTSNLVLENSGDQSSVSKFAYANHLGILQDEFGNELFFDEYPAVTDEFSVEENYDISEDNEFSEGYIFAYKHVSRYFHVDQEDLVQGSEPLTLQKEKIIVEDEDGNEYVDLNNKKRYKVKLLKSDEYLETQDRTIGVYRIWVFIDTDINESLYLRYNKAELSSDGKYIKNQKTDYREILNPQPYFSYVPEETDVTDLGSLNKKIYSTKSTSQKEQIIGIPRSSSEGYKVYVPRKAIQDPRLFQTFRWRIKADFQERYTIDPENQPKVIRAGVLISNNSIYPRRLSDLENQGPGIQYNYLQPPTNFPYVFYNLEKSDYNPSGAKIVNPLSEDRGYTIVEDIDPAVQSPTDGNALYNSPSFTWKGNITAPLKRVSGEGAKEYASYWIVNFDTVTDEELRKFDILFLDPTQFPADLSKYTGKIYRFTREFGGLLYIPLGGYGRKVGLGPTTTLPIHPYTGVFASSTFASGVSNADKSFGLGDTIAPRITSDELFNGLNQYGGWDFDSDSYASVSPFKFHPSVLYTKERSYVQFINSAEDAATNDGLEYWKTLFEVNERAASSVPGQITTPVVKKYPVTLIKRFASGGSIIYDTQNIIAECAKLEDSVNIAPRRLQIPSYFQQINSGRFEGSYKFAWNSILATIKSRPLDSSDQSSYVSSWSFETEWKPSWVINGGVLKTAEKTKYSFNYEPEDLNSPNTFAWRRKLAYGLNSASYPIFKTIKEIVDEQIVKEMGQQFLLNISGSSRKYSIEVTNANVKVPVTLVDDMYPYAWTNEYSPTLLIPEGFGPHIVREDPIMAQYSSGQYIDKSYPPNKFAVKVKASYRETAQSTKRETTTILARYRGKEILPNGFIYSHVFLPRTWTEHGSNQLLFNRFNKAWGAPRPNSILSRNELFLSQTTAYPFAGIAGSYSQGSSGEVVRFIQYSLNKLHEIIGLHLNRGVNGPIPDGMIAQDGYAMASSWALKYRLPSGQLDQSGVFDERTAEAVKSLKVLAGSRYADGIADSDFFSILGSQIQFWGLTTDINENTRNPGSFDTSEYNYLRYTAYANRYMDLKNISDSSTLYNYVEMSDSRRPDIDRISDVFLIQYPKVYNFDHISVTPYLLGQGSNINIDFVDVRKTRVDTTRFTGDMLNKAWQYFEIEERSGGGSGWVPDSPRILWGQNPEYWGSNNVKQTTWDYRYWNGITKTPVSYSALPFVSVENEKAYIRMLQRALQVYPDGIFGPATAAAARRWKVTRASQWGIPVDSNWGLISAVTTIQKLLGLPQDGFYGPETERAVMNWQANWNGAMPVDGFWGPITQKFTDELFIFLGGTPTVERIQRHLPQPYFVWPENLLRSYDPAQALIPRANITAPVGTRTDVSLPQNTRSIGNTIIVGVSSTQRAGIEYGNQLQLGISDITGYGRDYVGFRTLSGEAAVIDYEGVVTKAFTFYGDIGPIQLNHNYGETGAPGRLTDVEWGIDPISEVSTTIFPGFDPSSVGLFRIESSNPNVEAFITRNGKVYLRTSEVINNNTSNYTEGRWLPGPPDQPLNGKVFAISSRNPDSVSEIDTQKNPVYAMDENGRIFPGVETGFISKADGIKLLCTLDGKPIGIPVMPSGIGAEEYQRHYVDIELESYATSPFVNIGFYDKNQKEFIINKDGSSKLSYIEYVKRGPQNIYIGVVSSAEVVEKKNLPQVVDGLNELPFKYVMPVYGLVSKTKTKIGIEPINSNLGATDIWGVPIRVGSFNRNINLPSYSSSPIVGWLSKYQGRTVHAFYSVPEANLNSWSSIFGRPYIDVKGEHPNLLQEDVLQVRQFPILSVTEPTQKPSLSDPERPVLKVWTRQSIDDEWTELKRSDVIDYNLSNGLVYLRTPLPQKDSNLIKVDYTTVSRVYTAKSANGQKVNLNPYLKIREDMIGVPVYVYLVPEYVKNEDMEIIDESTNSSTVKITTDNSEINPYDPFYNPLAVQLGVIFVSATARVDDLVVLDTRKRGGGAVDSLKTAEIFNENTSALSYWDVGFGAGNTFQTGGFVVIRLPKMLKVVFPDTKEVEQIIRRNISAGVEFVLEDLEGRPWDE